MKTALALGFVSWACSGAGAETPGGAASAGASGSAGTAASAGTAGAGNSGGVAGTAAVAGFGAVSGEGGTSGAGAVPGKDGCGSNLTVTIRDLQNAHPDMEICSKSPTTKSCVADPGMVLPDLGADFTPVYAGPATGTASTSGPMGFHSWYHDVSGAGVLDNQKTTLTLEFQLDPATNLTFYRNETYFPVDGMFWGNENGVHNYHFTSELHTVFVYRPGDVFLFSGDDDVWVFINNRLVVDLGGIHNDDEAIVNADTLGLTPMVEYPLDFFHAERHVTQSKFGIRTNLFFTKCGGPPE
jgi:fibro-slime domain-containing protein